MKLHQHLQHQVMLASLAAVCFFIDLNIPLGDAAGVPYITVILASVWGNSARSTIIWTIACVVLTAVGFAVSPQGGEQWKVFMNRSLAVYAIASVAFMVVIWQRRERKLSDAMAELRKRRADSHLSMVARYSTDGIIITDPRGLVTWVNESFSRLSGYSLGDLLGRKPGELLQGVGSDLKEVERIRRAIKLRQ
ncbi:PAS domain-containing protein [Aliagarivorans taiwanensis]|uniref:PAS domain-containing protein n=1 Tax=Aliagarivorans taiwanensis TaxID=561966 RepID=UPI000A030BA4|nr:PAS domain-containing protein [Aliagarivorans taiwanensis]